MNANECRDEICQAATNTDISESGGSQNQKGVDFQRYWAILRMFDLQESNRDFLLLFEVFQDIAETDSSSAPTTVRIYQVKKKDGRPWSWGELTNLPNPNGRKNRTSKSVKGSPIGKLYASMLAFTRLESEGCFVSNVRCDVQLSSGTLAKITECSLEKLSVPYISMLQDQLSSLHDGIASLPDLSRIKLLRIPLPPDDPKTYVIGRAHRFLGARSPHHANQAESLVDALFATIASLGSRTDECSTYDHMCKERGFSRADLQEALSSLEQLPDLVVYVDPWMQTLQNEGMSIAERTTLKAAITRIHGSQLNEPPLKDQEVINDSDQWLRTNPQTGGLREWLETGCDCLCGKHHQTKRIDLLAHLVIRAIKLCVDQTTDG